MNLESLSHTLLDYLNSTNSLILIGAGTFAFGVALNCCTNNQDQKTTAGLVYALGVGILGAGIYQALSEIQEDPRFFEEISVEGQWKNLEEYVKNFFNGLG